MGKTEEFWKFPAPEGEEIVFPVATVTGEKPGPTVVVAAGIHGCEYPGIAAAIALYKELKPEEISGVVRIVTITSVKAFEARKPFVCPVDEKNPNRFFPGRLDGTYTEVQTYHILHDILKGADYYLDLHGGDMVEALEPFSIFHQGESEEVNEMSRKLAYYYGLPNMVMTTWQGEWPDSGTTYANAAERGIPSAIVEVGGIGQMDKPSIEKHLAGLRNVLRLVGVLPGEVQEPEVTFYAGFKWIYTPWKGIFYTHIQVGDVVEAGAVIGHMEDYFGNWLGDITAPKEGKITFLETTPAMGENSLICGLAYH